MKIPGLPDPDDIGASEYRLIHDFIQEVYHEERGDYAFVLATLDEIREWAESLSFLVNKAAMVPTSD